MNEFTAEQMKFIQKMESDHSMKMAKLDKLHSAVKGKRVKLQKESEAIEKLNILNEKTLEKVSKSPAAQVLALDPTGEDLKLGVTGKSYKKMVAVKGAKIVKRFVDNEKYLQTNEKNAAEEVETCRQRLEQFNEIENFVERNTEVREKIQVEKSSTDSISIGHTRALVEQRRNLLGKI